LKKTSEKPGADAAIATSDSEEDGLNIILSKLDLSEPFGDEVNSVKKYVFSETGNILFATTLMDGEKLSELLSPLSNGPAYLRS